MGKLLDILDAVQVIDLKTQEDMPYYQRFFYYFKSVYTLDDAFIIVYDLNTKEYYKFVSPIFIQIHDEDVDKIIFEWAELVNFTLSTQKLRMIHTYLRSHIGIPTEEWDSDPRYIAVQNGVVDLQERKLVEPSPAYHLRHLFNFRFTPFPGPTPYIETYRKMYPEAMDVVERYLQSVIRYDLSIRQALFIFGRSGSGKSTLLNAIQKVLGPMAKNGSLKDFNDPKYAYSYILDCRVMMDKDHRGETLNKDAIEVFLKLVGGDLDDGVIVNMKYRKPFIARIRTFFIIASNQFAKLPYTTNLTAWFRRVRIVLFNNKIEKADPYFGEKLIRDMDNWFSKLILDPYLPLVDHFEDMDAYAQKQQHIWEKSSNPLRAFIQEIFEHTTDLVDRITLGNIREILRKHFIDEGISVPYERTFEKQIVDTLTELDYRVSDPFGNGRRYVTYIKLREKWEEKYLDYITEDFEDIFKKT